MTVVQVLVTTSVVADETDVEQQTSADAMTDEAYERALGFKSLVERLASLGLSIDDVDPENLPFASTDHLDCFARLDRLQPSRDEAAIGFAACVKRHSDWNNDRVRDQMERISREEARRRDL